MASQSLYNIDYIPNGYSEPQHVTEVPETGDPTIDVDEILDRYEREYGEVLRIGWNISNLPALYTNDRYLDREG